MVAASVKAHGSPINLGWHFGHLRRQTIDRHRGAVSALAVVWPMERGAVVMAAGQGGRDRRGRGDSDVSPT